MPDLFPASAHPTRTDRPLFDDRDDIHLAVLASSLAFLGGGLPGVARWVHDAQLALGASAILLLAVPLVVLVAAVTQSIVAGRLAFRGRAAVLAAQATLFAAAGAAGVYVMAAFLRVFGASLGA